MFQKQAPKQEKQCDPYRYKPKRIPKYIYQAPMKARGLNNTIRNNYGRG